MDNENDAWLNDTCNDNRYEGLNRQICLKCGCEVKDELDEESCWCGVKIKAKTGEQICSI